MFQLSPVTTPIEDLSRSLHSNQWNDVNENQIHLDTTSPNDVDRDSLHSFTLAHDSTLHPPTSIEGDITPASYRTAQEEPPDLSMRGKRSSIAKSKLDKESREKIRRAKTKGGHVTRSRTRGHTIGRASQGQ